MLSLFCTIVPSYAIYIKRPHKFLRTYIHLGNFDILRNHLRGHLITPTTFQPDTCKIDGDTRGQIKKHKKKTKNKYIHTAYCPTYVSLVNVLVIVASFVKDVEGYR